MSFFNQLQFQKVYKRKPFRLLLTASWVSLTILFSCSDSLNQVFKTQASPISQFLVFVLFFINLRNFSTSFYTPMWNHLCKSLKIFMISEISKDLEEQLLTEFLRKIGGFQSGVGYFHDFGPYFSIKLMLIMFYLMFVSQRSSQIVESL